MLCLESQSRLSSKASSSAYSTQIDANEHSAFYRFDDYTLQLSVFALKDIRPGDEITFSCKFPPSYLRRLLQSTSKPNQLIDGFSKDSHSTRQKALEENWGFTCTCPLCTSSDAEISASDTRIKEIADIKKVLPSDPEAIPQLIALLPNLIKLLDEEGLVVEKPMYEEILAYAWSTMGKSPSLPCSYLSR